MNRVSEVLCVTQLSKMDYCYRLYNTVIFIIFTVGCYITLSLALISSLHLLSLVNLFVANLMTPYKSKTVVLIDYMIMNNELERMCNEEAV